MNYYEVNQVLYFVTSLIPKYPNASEAALAAEPAAAQGKFSEMYDFLFKHGQVVTDDNLRRSAANLRLKS